jgi:predicted aconitase with swiveling domain
MPWGILLMSVAVLAGCENAAAVERTERQIQDVDFQRVQALVDLDIAQHQAGVVKAAQKLAPGFALSDPVARESQVRSALRILQQPKKGIDEFVASPMSFLAAVGVDGRVIARDRDPDRMKGQDFKTRFEVVREALGGTAATGLGEFYAKDPSAPSSWSILFAAPSLRDDRVVGAVLAGIPLSRLAQRLSRQFRVEQKEGAPVWVYVYKGKRLFHWDTPPEVDALVRDPVARAEGLAGSPSGYTERVRLQGELQVYGVFPLELLGPDVGMIIFRTPE